MADGKSVPAIPVSNRIVGPGVERIDLVEAVVKGFPKRISSREGQSSGEALCEIHLQRVEVAIQAGAAEISRSEAIKRREGKAGQSGSGQRHIERPAERHLPAHIPRVSDI